MLRRLSMQVRIAWTIFPKDLVSRIPKQETNLLEDVARLFNFFVIDTQYRTRQFTLDLTGNKARLY